MTLEITLKVRREFSDGDKTKFFIECESLFLSTEGDSIGVALVAMIKKLTAIAQGVHLFIKIENE